MPKDIGFIYKQ